MNTGEKNLRAGRADIDSNAHEDDVLSLPERVLLNAVDRLIGFAIAVRRVIGVGMIVLQGRESAPLCVQRARTIMLRSRRMLSCSRDDNNLA